MVKNIEAWISQDGRQLLIKDMPKEHIENAINLLKRARKRLNDNNCVLALYPLMGFTREDLAFAENVLARNSKVIITCDIGLKSLQAELDKRAAQKDIAEDDDDDDFDDDDDLL